MLRGREIIRMNCGTGRGFRARLGSAMIIFRFVGSSCLFGLDYSVTAKFPRFLGGRRSSKTKIRRCPELRITSGRLQMFALCSHGRDMPLMFRRLFLRRWTRVDPSIPSVVAHSVNRGGIDRSVVDVVDIGDVYIHHGAVIEEMSVVPAPPCEPRAEIPESIIDPAVKPYGRSPITLVEDKCFTSPTPPAGGPQETNFGSQHPRAQHPEVVGGIVIPIPVAGSPYITITWANRLLIHRQCRWTNCDGYSELSE